VPRADAHAARKKAAREALLCDEILDLRAELDRLRTERDALVASRSRRLTAPLRALLRRG
jgi:hypothetical protein